MVAPSSVAPNDFNAYIEEVELKEAIKRAEGPPESHDLDLKDFGEDADHKEYENDNEEEDDEEGEDEDEGTSHDDHHEEIGRSG